MTIQSYGYSGSVDSVAWANIQQAVGCRYMVSKFSDCKVAPLVGGTRQVTISTGFAGGSGVLDEITEAETVTVSDAFASGIKYFLICLHRDWSTNTTTVKVITAAGTSLPSSMPTRDNTPGVSDDQPLALVSLAAGDTLPTVIYDLRAVGGPNGFNMSPDLAGLPNWINYMAFEGYTIWTGDKSWRRVTDPATGNPNWEVDPEIVKSGPNIPNGLSINGTSGWATSSVLESRGSRTGNDMKIRFQARRTGATLDFPNGSAGSDPILTIGNTNWRPPYNVPFAFSYVAGTGATYGGFALYTTAGEVQLISVTPGTSIGKSPVNGIDRTSFSGVAEWTREA